MQSISNARIAKKEEYNTLLYKLTGRAHVIARDFTQKDALVLYAEEPVDESVESDDEGLDNAFPNPFDLLFQKSDKVGSDEESSLGTGDVAINSASSHIFDNVRNRQSSPNPSITTLSMNEETAIKFDNTRKIEQELLVIPNRHFLLLYKLFTKSRANELNIRHYIKRQFEEYKEKGDPRTPVYLDLVEKIQNEDERLLNYQTEVDTMVVRLSSILKKVDVNTLQDPILKADLLYVNRSVERLEILKKTLTNGK
jgi:hypothetical protein